MAMKSIPPAIQPQGDYFLREEMIPTIALSAHGVGPRHGRTPTGSDRAKLLYYRDKCSKYACFYPLDGRFRL